MQVKTVRHPRLLKDKSRLLTNLAFSIWFKEEVKRVNASGNRTRIRRYAKLDPFRMVVEPPTIFKDDYFVVCADDRKAGTLLPDKKVPYLTLDIFVEAITKPVVNKGQYSEEILDLVEEGMDADDLKTIVDNPGKLSKQPIYHLCKLNDQDTYTVIFDHVDGKFNFDELVESAFKGFRFESIELVLSKDDDKPFTPKPTVSDISSFYCGVITVKDKLFKEKTLTFNFINLYHISQ